MTAPDETPRIDPTRNEDGPRPDRPDRSGEPILDSDPLVRYRRKLRLGEGGMAEVYKAFDRALRRPVAMKIVKSERLPPPTRQVDRFIEEAQVTSQLQHPGITPLYDLGVLDDGRPYFTMQPLEGLTLQEIIEDSVYRGSEWTRQRLLQIFVRVCETVAYAHSRRVIHRDLKPANIMVGRYGEVTILDWGISKVVSDPESRHTSPESLDDSKNPDVVTIRKLKADQTLPGRPMGTPHYMSPEQARGRPEEVDERSDIYSLGIILFEVLTKRLPFEDAAYDDFSFVDQEVPPPERFDPAIPEMLSLICQRCLAPHADLRYRAVEELIADLNRFLDPWASFERRQVMAGEQVIARGGVADEAYFILRGEAEVGDVKDGQRVLYATLKPGDVFGEIAIFTGEPRNADVVARTDLELLVFDRRTIREELNKVQPWLGDMINNLAEKLVKLNEKYAALLAEGPPPTER